MACPDRDDLVAYSLGALEADEERAVEVHLPDCERCTRELRALAPAVAVLGESVEQVEPPRELRERVMDTVHSEAAHGGEVDAPASRRSRIGSFLLRPAAGLAALAFVGAGAAGYLIADEDTDGTDTIPVSEGGTGIGGSLEVSGESAVLAVRGMPPLKQGGVYQVWVDQGDRVWAASSFMPDPSGNATAAVPAQLDRGDQVLVTWEPNAGSEVPTTPAMLTARVD